jgi:predicted nucleotidyltransferase component of viral defense system
VISHADIVARAREWDLREDIVEKDYVIGWVLWGIGRHKRLTSSWAFKGGTCLKKCYIETYRFSEDLDFTVLPGGPVEKEALEPLLDEVLRNVHDESGIDFAGRVPMFKTHSSGQYTEGRIYYRGPRNAPSVASIKLDLSASEKLARPTVLRRIAHAFPDTLPESATVRCYGFEELFAEKLRAMGERCRPRDLYDIVNLYRRPDLRRHAELIRTVLEEKCASKGVTVPTYKALDSSPLRRELETEWQNMLAHQLPALPPIEAFWHDLQQLFLWLEGTGAEPVAARIKDIRPSDEQWSPPPTVWTWGFGVPVETLRFAAANHLCIELGYNGTTRLIEPYSFRRSKAGDLLLYAIKRTTGETRCYKLAMITSIKVSTVAFVPRYRVEISGSVLSPNGLAARGSGSLLRDGFARKTARPVRVVICPVCNREFRRTSHSVVLRPHKDEQGRPCRGRRGRIVERSAFYL